MGTFDKYLQLADKTYFNRLGKVTKIVGLTIESVGPNALKGKKVQLQVPITPSKLQMMQDFSLNGSS